MKTTVCSQEGCAIYTYLAKGSRAKWWCREHAAECADGTTYEHPRDHERLAAQRTRVKAVMRDGAWHTLEGISATTGDPPASVSARLRDFRKVKFGAHIVERQYVSHGLWEYRLYDQPSLGVKG